MFILSLKQKWKAGVKKIPSRLEVACVYMFSKYSKLKTSKFQIWYSIYKKNQINFLHFHFFFYVQQCYFTQMLSLSLSLSLTLTQVSHSFKRNRFKCPTSIFTPIWYMRGFINFGFWLHFKDRIAWWIEAHSKYLEGQANTNVNSPHS